MTKSSVVSSLKRGATIRTTKKSWYGSIYLGEGLTSGVLLMIWRSSKVDDFQVGDLVQNVYTKSMCIVIDTRWTANVLVCTVVHIATCREQLIASHKLIKINKNT